VASLAVDARPREKAIRRVEALMTSTLLILLALDVTRRCVTFHGHSRAGDNPGTERRGQPEAPRQGVHNYCGEPLIARRYAHMLGSDFRL
jgi:hypothetical protein